MNRPQVPEPVPWLNARVTQTGGRRRATEHVRALLSAWVDFEDSSDRELLETITTQAIDDVMGDRDLAAEMIGLLSALATVAIRMQSAERSESPQKILQELSLDIERRLGDG
jgi:hypothetical protein